MQHLPPLATIIKAKRARKSSDFNQLPSDNVLGSYLGAKRYMKQSDKIRVAVLYGGRSAEHEVSLQSASNVIQYLDPELFEIIPIGIDKQGSWFLGKDVFAKSLEHKKVPHLQDSTSTWFTPEWVGKPVAKHQIKELIAPQASEKFFDVVFPVVHGSLCEDGT